MKFGDKLILLRKKNNLSQEDLAEKLGVSRQSVSKWESNNSYPETDKIVQICNLFDCSMDALINDNIINIEDIERKDKNNLNIVIDSFLDFITKTINMFSDMKFSSGLKCIVEMFILIFILFILGCIVVGATTGLIENIFYFVPGFNNLLHYTIQSIITILWIIVSIIILVHTFKIRYLNYYEKIVDDDKENEKSDKKIKFEKKEKVIIRDEKHRPFAFLSVLSNIIIFFIKFFLVFVVFGLILSLVFLVMSFIISLFLTPVSLIFFGSDLALIASILINLVFLIFIINFIFNKNSKYKELLIIFLISLIVLGVGIGISTISFKNIDFKEYNLSNNITELEKVSYEDNLVIISEGLNDIEYEVDNTESDIKVEINYNNKLNNYRIKLDNYYGLNTYEIHMDDKTISPKDIYNLIIKDLKNNELKADYSKFKVKVIASNDKINKLIDNTSKVYVFEKQEKENGYILKNIVHKINREDYCPGKNYYNAITGELKTSNNCKCEVSNDEEFINLTCDTVYGE